MRTDAHAHTSACCGLGVHFWIRLMQRSQSSACNNPAKDFTAFGSACVEMQMDANVAPGSLVLLTTKDPHFFHQPNVCRHNKWIQMAPLCPQSHLHLEDKLTPIGEDEAFDFNGAQASDLEITWISRDWDERIETLRLVIFLSSKNCHPLSWSTAGTVSREWWWPGTTGRWLQNRLQRLPVFQCMTLWWTVFHQWLLPYTDYTDYPDYTVQCCCATGKLSRPMPLRHPSTLGWASPTSEVLSFSGYFLQVPVTACRLCPKGFWVNCNDLTATSL